MKITRIPVAVLVMVSLFFMFLLVPAASAAPASEVVLNQATLNATTPYWVNGTTTAVAYAANWNAHFDAATATLTLRNAVINQTTLILGYTTVYTVIQAAGDLTIVLEGKSSLSEPFGMLSGNDSLVAVYSTDSITVRGDGEMDITYDGDGQLFTVYAANNLYWLSGALWCERLSGDYLCGPNCKGDELLIAGGSITVRGVVNTASGLSVSNGVLHMIGGSVHVTLTSTSVRAYGVYAGGIVFTGGTAVFDTKGSAESYGADIYRGSMSMTGGSCTLMGETAAIHFYGTTMPPTTPEPGMAVLVSENRDGTNARRWYSVSEGSLAIVEESWGYFTAVSDFRYVRFYRPQPQTGDNATPWLWMGIGLLCLLGAAGATAAIRGKRRTV